MIYNNKNNILNLKCERKTHQSDNGSVSIDSIPKRIPIDDKQYNCLYFEKSSCTW